MNFSSFDEKKRKHEENIRNSVEKAKDAANYCTYFRETSLFDKDVTVYGARVRGRSHINKSKPCQDYCLAETVGKGQILVVSDGVSACLRSDKGSLFACEASVKVIRELDAECADEKSFIKALCGKIFRKAIVSNWIDMIKKDVAETDGKDNVSIQDIELYGATLSLAVMTENSIVTLNLGDGQILLFNSTDAMRVRWHQPKEDSVTAALCNANCYEDAFIVHVHDRAMYNGILLSTDGIYDTLSNYTGFYSYARQISERFEAFGEPMQPFCFNEVTKDGTRDIDLSANISEDDCSVILAIDHTPVRSYISEAFAALSAEYRILELSSRADGTAVYELKKNENSYKAVVSAEKYPETEELKSYGFSKSKIISPLYTKEAGEYTVSVYDDIPYFTPIGYFSIGRFKEKAEIKYGINASRLPYIAYTMLTECEKELREKGLRLNDNARFLSFFTNEGLVLMRDAVSVLKNGEKAELLWQMFDNIIGTLICENTARPVFSIGFKSAGAVLMNPFVDGTPTPLCYVKQNGEGELFLVNAGETPWKFTDNTTVSPKDSVPLADGMTFEFACPKNGKTVTARYERRAEIIW
jgi:serine/threonine protein phosphatase PrpC